MNQGKNVGFFQVRWAHKSGDVINFIILACIISSRLKWYKNYKNRPRLAKVIVENKMSRFYGSLCRSGLDSPWRRSALSKSFCFIWNYQKSLTFACVTNFRPTDKWDCPFGLKSGDELRNTVVIGIFAHGLIQTLLRHCLWSRHFKRNFDELRMKQVRAVQAVKIGTSCLLLCDIRRFQVWFWQF